MRKFSRVALKSGESEKVSFQLDPEDLIQFNEKGQESVELGKYHIFVGGGSPGTRSKELVADLADLLETDFTVK